jgi:hypothetical protein
MLRCSQWHSFALSDAELIVLSAPEAVVAAEFEPHPNSGTIATEACSTEASVIRDLAPHLATGDHVVPLLDRYTPRIALNARNA